ncbi:ketosteroid isomerase [Archaeoglobales archaeon]|nr:MAG: ketosteroid isomerase [Archaeoglobales archaeon]
MKVVNMPEDTGRSEQENVQLIKQMFAAFGRGDIPAILDIIAENVDWQSPVTRNPSIHISWAKPRYTREEVATYFKELSDKVKPEHLEILEFIAKGDRVVVEGRNRGIVRSTGHTYEHDWVMIFTLRGGKIVRFRHYYDTADLVVAFRE